MEGLSLAAVPAAVQSADDADVERIGRPIGGTVAVTFEEIYARFRRPIWSLARRLTGSEEEALDACQEIFLRVWRGLDGFRNEAKLSTWVFQIGWNFLRNDRRRKGRRPFIVDGLDGTRGLEIGSIRDHAPDPERRAIASEGLSRAVEALERLAEHHRIVLWLRDGEDLSYEEIAEVLDVPVGTVRSRLARARRALKSEVER